MVSSMEEFFGSNSKKHGTDQAGYDPFPNIRLIIQPAREACGPEGPARWER